MSNILDRVFAEVCLDERVSDGVFRMDEEAHMDALREYFIKKGIPKEEAIHITNRMVEGKYPERQAYRKEDGILVTWPSPQHKQKAMQKEPGKYTEQNPSPKKETEPKQKVAPPGSKPEPGELPNSDKKAELDAPEKSGDKEPEKKTPSIFAGNQELAVEPPKIDGQPEPPPQAPQPPVQIPRTPERIAAEKEITRQIMNTDDTVLSNVANPINEECRRQLNELYKKAYEMNFKEAVTFLTKYVKP